MVKVYFESGLRAELVAVFSSEEIYNACYPELEAMSIEEGKIMTESVEEEQEFEEIAI